MRPRYSVAFAATVLRGICGHGTLHGTPCSFVAFGGHVLRAAGSLIYSRSMNFELTPPMIDKIAFAMEDQKERFVGGRGVR